MIEQGERDELIKALNRFNDKAEQVIRSNSSASNITVNAGGFGVWVCVCAFVGSLSMMLVAGFWISRELNRVDARFTEQVDVDSVQDAYIHKLRAEQRQEKP